MPGPQRTWRCVLPATAAVSVVLLATLAARTSAAEHEHAGGNKQARDPRVAWDKALARTPLAVSAAFDESGRLWQVSITAGFVVVRHSDDKGQTFSAPVHVNAQAARIAGDGDNRPKIAVAPDGTVYVSYTEHLSEPFAGHVYLARSADGGRTFAAATRVNSDPAPISHRFESFALDGNGRVHILWIDKRDAAAARARGITYAGAALYYATTEHDGARLSPNRKLVDHSCECCRLALAFDIDGTPVVAWRHIYGRNTRDHALLRLDGKSQPVRIAHDGWEIDACPHHGPALAIDTGGAYHVVWFTGAPGRAGLYYARSTDRGANWSNPRAFGHSGAQAARPSVLATGQAIHVAWKEFDGKATVVYAMRSDDGGITWSTPKVCARSTSASDHPLLIADGGTVYLSWSAAAEGYRLIPLS
jgi:hypothetical protein